MALAGCLHLSHDLGLCKSHCYNKQFKIVVAGRGQGHFLSSSLPVCNSFQSWDSLGFHLADRPIRSIPRKYNGVRCHFSLVPGKTLGLDNLKIPAEHFMRSLNSVQSGIPVNELVPAVGLILFTVWGLGPLLQQSRNRLFHKNDSSWKNSKTHCVLTSYFQPLLLWTGTLLICRALDPVVLTTEASQVVKQRLLHFVGSLSTVLVFAYCLSSMIQQAQNFFMGSNESDNTRKMGWDFAGKAVYSAVWVGAIALFMELLGFSTQKWLTAGGLGTVLLTLAGREIFTNFLSSVMIHATRPFIVNEWIQTRIQGYDVSGTVEYVGWWSPTIVRGQDREALHIPNHKFTVNIVRNLTQKTHWRIKTHLAISHLDVNKINVIIADMRKVLAKNPQIEQQRLHRRVFLENVNAESQALSILISCFVKTSRFEDYLCAKEGIVMDLLRVISHHQARLATPIRTMQKIYSDADLENIPFADSIFNDGGGDGDGDGDGDGGGVASKRPFLLIEPSYRISSEEKAKAQSHSDKKTDAKVVEKSASDIPKSGQDPSSGGKTENTPPSTIKTGTEEANGSQEGERSPTLQENLVLSAALEGSKETLPIDKDRSRNGSSTPDQDKKDDQILSAPDTIATGQ